MKVLHLIGGGDVGGAKVHVLSLVKELSAHIDVKIVSFRSGMFSDEAVSMGIDIEVVRKGNIFLDIKRVVEIIRQGQYQIIHSHGAKANMVSLVARRLTKLVTVTTVHSDYRLDYLHSISKRFSIGLFNTIALRFLNYHIGVSKSFKEMLVNRKFNSRKIFTLYNGINFKQHIPEYSRAEFSKKFGLDLDSSDVIVGILARLDPVKGLDVFIRAAKQVLDEKPSVKFLIGGPGEQQRSLERMVKWLGISDNVFFLGYVNDPYEFMSCVDINVLTSISESFPYSLLEGSIFKKATISSNVGGISDLIETGLNGFLFKPGDYLTLARYIVRLVEDSNLRTEMGEKIYNKANKNFSLDNMCKTQLEIYTSILSEQKTRSKVKPYYDVIISGYYGFENIGDDAMLMAIVNNLRTYKPDIKIIVLSKKPLETSTIYNVDSINRVNLLYIFLAMRKAKLFIYGGGNIIQDNTSTRSLIYYLSTILLAKKMHLKVMFYANGIGPLNKNTNQKLTQKIINQVNVITLREQLSLKELKRLHIDKPQIFLTADPALTIQPSPHTEAYDIFSGEGINSSGPFVGFSIRKWKGREKYEEIIAKTADYMIEVYGATPVFIPMQHTDDLSIIENVVSKMKGKGYIIRNKYNVSQTLDIINRMDMLIGMRLHALIFAASLSIPIVGLVYEPKIEGFLECSRQSSAGYVTNLQFDKLKDLVDYVWNRRKDIGEQLEKDIPKLKEKALDNARIAVDLITSPDDIV